MLLQDWIDLRPNIVLPGEELGGAGRFGYLASCIPPGGRMLDKTLPGIHQSEAFVTSE